MCNWIDCDVSFSGDEHLQTAEGSEGSQSSSEGMDAPTKILGQTCSKCKLVKYCSSLHQKKDWDEHRRVCKAS
jgi:hypothetical protein